MNLRMTEILHTDTSDSYRVKANNVISLLIEFRGVLENWTLGNIKNYQTVSYCHEEIYQPFITSCKYPLLSSLFR